MYGKTILAGIRCTSEQRDTGKGRTLQSKGGVVAPTAGGASTILIPHSLQRRTAPKIHLYYCGTEWGSFSNSPLSLSPSPPIAILPTPALYRPVPPAPPAVLSRMQRTLHAGDSTNNRRRFALGASSTFQAGEYPACSVLGL